MVVGCCLCVRIFFFVSTIIEKKNLRKESSIIFLFSLSPPVDYCFVTSNIFCGNHTHTHTLQSIIYSFMLNFFVSFLSLLYGFLLEFHENWKWMKVVVRHQLKLFFRISIGLTTIAYLNNYAFFIFIYWAVAGRIWSVHVPFTGFIFLFFFRLFLVSLKQYQRFDPTLSMYICISFVQREREIASLSPHFEPVRILIRNFVFSRKFI